MGIYKQKFNPVSGQFNLVPTGTIVTFKESVANAAALPLTGNELNDARITDDTGHLYIWDGTQWVDQGDIIDLTWDSIVGKPSSTPTQIDNAVSDSHAAHSDDQDLSGKEDVANKSTDENLGLSDTLYPSQKAVKDYVDTIPTNINTILSNQVFGG